MESERKVKCNRRRPESHSKTRGKRQRHSEWKGVERGREVRQRGKGQRRRDRRREVRKVGREKQRREAQRHGEIGTEAWSRDGRRRTNFATCILL